MTLKIAFLARVAAVGVLMGCNDTQPDANQARDLATGNYRAQVLAFEGTASGESSTSYKLKTVTFTTLTDLKELDGPYIHIVKGGQLYIKDIEGSAVSSDRFEGGGSPQLRYRIERGVIVPRDYNTLLLLSAYYQFERMTAARDENGKAITPLMQSVTGYTPDAFFKAMGKFRVMFEPKIRIEGDGQTIDASIKLNAAFVPGQSQFILFQRSNLERVPLAANLQVIAHEFGHAVFERTFFENKFVPCKVGAGGGRFFSGRFSSEFAITGMNEGFADVTSWGFTGSTDILRGSIDLGDRIAQRNFGSVPFTYSSLASNNDDVCAGRFYCIGTLFAKSVREAALSLGVRTSDDAARRVVTSDVVAAVAKVPDTLRTLDASVLPAPSKEVSECEIPEEITPGYDGQVAGAFLAAFVKNLPVAKRAAYCKAFAKNFETLGFPDAARKVACP